MEPVAGAVAVEMAWQPPALVALVTSAS
jgi:hypothetical protein